MGWEKRGSKSYYYRKVREGNKVRSKYMGSGFDTQLQVMLIENDRQIRQEEREELHRMQKMDKDIDRQIAEVEKVVAVSTNALFHTAGYHKHRGQWRKRHATTLV